MLQRENLIIAVVLLLAGLGAWGFLILTKPALPSPPPEELRESGSLQDAAPSPKIRHLGRVRLLNDRGVWNLDGRTPAGFLSHVGTRPFRMEFDTPFENGVCAVDPAKRTFEFSGKTRVCRGSWTVGPDQVISLVLDVPFPAELLLPRSVRTEGMLTGKIEGRLTPQGRFEPDRFSGRAGKALRCRSGGYSGTIEGAVSYTPSRWSFGSIKLDEPFSLTATDVVFEQRDHKMHVTFSTLPDEWIAPLFELPVRTGRAATPVRLSAVAGEHGVWDAEAGDGMRFSLGSEAQSLTLKEGVIDYQGGILRGKELFVRRDASGRNTEVRAESLRFEAFAFIPVVTLHSFRFERKEAEETLSFDSMEVAGAGSARFHAGATRLQGQFLSTPAIWRGESAGARVELPFVSATGNAESLRWHFDGGARTGLTMTARGGGFSSGVFHTLRGEGVLTIPLPPDRSLRWSWREKSSLQLGTHPLGEQCTLAAEGLGGAVRSLTLEGKDFSLGDSAAKKFSVKFARASERSFDSTVHFSKLRCGSLDFSEAEMRGLWNDRLLSLRSAPSGGWNMTMALRAGEQDWTLDTVAQLREEKTGREFYLGTLQLRSPFDLELLSRAKNAEVTQQTRVSLDGGTLRFGDLTLSGVRGIMELSQSGLLKGSADLRAEQLVIGAFRAGASSLALSFPGTGAYRIGSGTFRTGGAEGRLLEPLVSTATGNMTSSIRVDYPNVKLDELFALSGVDGEGTGRFSGFGEYHDGKLIRANFLNNGPGTVEMGGAVEASAVKIAGDTAFAAAALKKFHYRIFRFDYQLSDGRPRLRCMLTGSAAEKLPFLYDEDSGAFLASDEPVDFGEFEISVDLALPKKR